MFSVLTGGAAELAHRPVNVEGIVHQLHPQYFLTIVGAGKVRGAVVVLAPRFARLKEGTYAGIFVNMTEAAASWAMRGGSPGHLVPTLFL
jgi:hypothetical protein